MMADRYIHRQKKSSTPSKHSSPSSPAPAWMTCFVCKKKGCWSRNHTKEERITAEKASPFTKAKLSGSFNVSTDTDVSSQIDILELLEEIECSSPPHPEDVQPAANITASFVDDQDAPSPYVHMCTDAIFCYSITGTLDSQ